MGLLPEHRARSAAADLRGVADGGERAGRLDHLRVRPRRGGRCADHRRRRGPPARARQLLLWLLVAFTLGTVASALAPTFQLVLLARFVSALPHGAYFGIASLVAASLMGPGKRGRGVAFVLSGLTIANVVGVPLITWLGQAHGWRIAYLVVAAIFALTFVAVALLVPWQKGDPRATMANELKAFGRMQVWLALLIGAIGFGGFFAVYTYVAPMVTTVTGLSPSAVPLVLILIGVGMTVGNLVGGWAADRDLKRGMLFFFALLLVGLAALFFTAVERRRAADLAVRDRGGLLGALADHPDPADGCGAREPVDRGRAEPLGTEHRATRRAPSSAVSRSPPASATCRRSWSAQCSVVAGIVLALVSFSIDRSRERRGVDTGVVARAARRSRARRSTDHRWRSSRGRSRSRGVRARRTGAAVSRSGAGCRPGWRACGARPWCRRRSRRRGTSRGCA